ncbi:MAG: dephospho-CoA kinase [Bdellovibrionales bacterium]|nr:dephospho-CoA kinase [Bdellovibrionales bacterium]
MVKIAITGGIGTGKSSLCRFFEDWGFPVISADKEAHKALMIESPLYPSLLKLFNKKPSDRLNPKEIAKDIFSNLNLKKKFESIVHPYIFESILKEEKKIKNHSHIFYEIPLLFETNLMDYFNWIILVTCSKNLQKERVISKMHLSSEEAQMRIDAQNPQETKIESSDIVIENNGSLNDLKQKAEDILEKLALTKKDSSC